MYIVTCVHPLQVFVLMCTLSSAAYSTIVQCLYFKPRSKCESGGDVAGTILLFKVLYYKNKNVFFISCVCFFMCYLHKKYYTPITVQYDIADCVSWVPRLTLLDL